MMSRFLPLVMVLICNLASATVTVTITPSYPQTVSWDPNADVAYVATVTRNGVATNDSVQIWYVNTATFESSTVGGFGNATLHVPRNTPGVFEIHAQSGYVSAVTVMLT